MKKRDDGTLVVVSDFRATGPTRGMMVPILGTCGEVLLARQPGDQAPDPDDQPMVTPADLVLIRRRRIANTAARLLKKRQAQARRQERAESLARSRSPRQELFLSYDLRDWTINRPRHHFVGVYTWTEGAVADTRCRHQHRTAYTAIWCKDFPSDQPPQHVVMVSNATQLVVRSLKKIQPDA